MTGDADGCPWLAMCHLFNAMHRVSGNESVLSFFICSTADVKMLNAGAAEFAVGASVTSHRASETRAEVQDSERTNHCVRKYVHQES